MAGAVAFDTAKPGTGTSGTGTLGSGSPDRGTITDAELTALALAADPDIEVTDDAVCLWDLIDTEGRNTLPPWYMPAPMAGSRPLRRPWHRRVALLVIVSFLVIDALGFCITYGQLVVA